MYKRQSLPEGAIFKHSWELNPISAEVHINALVNKLLSWATSTRTTLTVKLNVLEALIITLRHVGKHCDNLDKVERVARRLSRKRTLLQWDKARQVREKAQELLGVVADVRRGTPAQLPEALREPVERPELTRERVRPERDSQ